MSLTPGLWPPDGGRLESSDPLFPAQMVFPLCEPSGVVTPTANVPGSVRPFAATLGVAPLECGKHETTASRNKNMKATVVNKDGKEVADMIEEVVTDT